MCAGWHTRCCLDIWNGEKGKNNVCLRERTYFCSEEGGCRCNVPLGARSAEIRAVRPTWLFVFFAAGKRAGKAAKHTIPYSGTSVNFMIEHTCGET